MSDSVRPHRRQPTRLPRPWDSPGKSTGVGCHFLLQCMEVKSESEVVQLCLTPSDPMDSSPQGSSIHGIFQARVLEWELNAKRCLFLTSSKKSESLWYKLETNTTIIRKKKKLSILAHYASAIPFSCLCFRKTKPILPGIFFLFAFFMADLWFRSVQISPSERWPLQKPWYLKLFYPFSHSSSSATYFLS